MKLCDDRQMTISRTKRDMPVLLSKVEWREE